MNIQEAINLIYYITKNTNPMVIEMPQDYLEEELFSKGDLMLVKIRGLNVRGAITCYLNGGNIYQIDGKANFESDFILCDNIDTVGITGTLTIEGYYYIKP